MLGTVRVTKFQLYTLFCTDQSRLVSHIITPGNQRHLNERSNIQDYILTIRCHQGHLSLWWLHLSLQPFLSEPESSTRISCSWSSLTNEITANHKHGALAMLHISLASSSSQERIRDLYSWEKSQKITQSRLVSQGRIIILMSLLASACLTSS